MTNRFRQDASINALFLWTVIINVAIPKAGVKLAGIPLTLGNVMIGLLLLYSLITGAAGTRKLTRPLLLYVIGGCFWLVRFLVAYAGGSQLSEFIGYLIPLCVYPAAFFVAPLYLRTRPQMQRLSRILFWCLLFLFLYTMLQATLGIGAVDIPGITVNYSDYLSNPSAWWLDKSNAVGDASKMVSTYQNGNLFGVTIILLFPIALSSERRPLIKLAFWVLFILSVLLAGSRTVYLGLMMLAVYYIVRAVTHMRFQIKTLAALAVAAFAAVVLLCVVVTSFAPDMFDRIMSIFDLETMLQGAGRTGGAIEYFTWLLGHPEALLVGGFGMDYEGFAYEMTYICVFLLGGIVGFGLFMAFLISALRSAVGGLPKGDTLARALFVGIVVYWIMAFVEGGYWLPPVAWNVWMIAGFARCYGAAAARAGAPVLSVQNVCSAQLV